MEDTCSPKEWNLNYKDNEETYETDTIIKHPPRSQFHFYEMKVDQLFEE